MIDTQDSNITHIFRYGSKVYGTNHEQSDDDYVIIVKNKQNIDINITEFTIDEFIQGVINCNIACLESYFLIPSSENILKCEFELEKIHIDKEKLRRSISAIASNAWAKCKKKLIVEKDYDEYIALKSLFHSLRILDYGIQIAKYNTIVDYSSMNPIYYEIFDLAESYERDVLWMKINEKYKHLRNSKHSEFKILCPFS